MMLYLIDFLFKVEILTADFASHTAFFVSNLFACFGTIYCIFLLYLNFKKIDSEIQQILSYFMITLIIIEPISVLFNLIGYKVSFHYPIAFSPILYFISNIGGIYYLKKHYSKRLDIKELVKNENLLKKEKLKLDYNALANQFNISQREFEIICLVLDGYTNQLISDKLFISPNTVKNHIYSIYKKVGVRSKLELSNYLIYGVKQPTKTSDNFK